MKAALVAGVKPGLVAVSVYPTPAASIERSLKVATPFAAVLTVVVPDSVLTLGFASIARVIGIPATATVAPAA